MQGLPGSIQNEATDEGQKETKWSLTFDSCVFSPGRGSRSENGFRICLIVFGEVFGDVVD